MLLFKTTIALENHLSKCRAAGQTIGFVPTMGALHEGHLSLIRTSKAATDLTVCSIFVNPTQFNDPNDLEKYPRQTDQDIDLLHRVATDILFLPEVEAIYPPDLDTSVNLDFGSLDKLMEGEHRPGHFNGVAQVVKRLLDVVQPDKLFMGQKDYQQFCICNSLITQLRLPVALVRCAIVREASGLAMSSRNARLTAEQRDTAAQIYAVLQATKATFSPQNIAFAKQNALEQLQLVPDFQVDYVEIADGETLLPATETSESIVICVAVFIGNVRLIDNEILK